MKEIFDLKKLIKHNHMVFILGMICFSLLFFIRDVLSVAVPNVIFIIFPCLIMVFCSPTEIIAYLACYPLWSTGFQANYTMLVALLLLLAKTYKELGFKKGIWIFIFAMVWELSHFWIAPFSFIEYFRIAAGYGAIAYVLCAKNIEIDYKFVMKSFVAVALFVLFDLLVQTLLLIDFNLERFFSIRFGKIELSTESEALTISQNENHMGMLCVIAICVQLLLHSTAKFKFVSVGIIIIFTIFALLTQSRTALIMLALCVICLTIYFCIHFKGRHYLIAGLLSLEAVLLVAFCLIFSDIVTNVIIRFTEEDITNGRIGLIMQYNDYYFSSWRNTLFGVGLQSLDTKSGFSAATHNGLQEGAVCWGVLGVVLSIAFFVIAIIPNKKEDKRTLFSYMPIVLFFVYIQAAQFVRLVPNVAVLVICYICANYIDKEA